MRNAAQVFRDAVKTLLIPPIIGGLLGMAEFWLDFPGGKENYWLHFERSLMGGVFLGAMVGLYWCSLGVFERALTRVLVGISVLAILMMCVCLGTL